MYKVLAVLVCAIAVTRGGYYSEPQISVAANPLFQPVFSTKATIKDSNLPEEQQIDIANKVQEIFDTIEDNDDRAEEIYSFLQEYKPGYKYTVVIGYRLISYYTDNYHISLIVNDKPVFIYGPEPKN